MKPCLCELEPRPLNEFVLNAHDRDIIERDQAIKGLGLLLQPKELAEQLDKRLDSPVPRPVQVTYLRYKPGSNCIARFKFGDQTGYAKAFGNDAGPKLAKADQRLSTHPTGTPAGVTLAEQGIVVTFFPVDLELRSLARLANEMERQQLLRRVFKADPGWAEADITTLNYKPERRYVARLNHPDGRAATLKFFGRREFDATRRSRKKLQLPNGLLLPAWIGGSKNHRAMAYEWLSGEPLDLRLTQGQTDEAGQAGAAIARLHASQQPALGQRQGRQPLEVLAALEKQLSWLAPDLADEVAEIGADLAHRWATRNRARRPVHGDFYDRQVIVQPSGVGIIDTDSARLGDPLEDLGCFLAHLERRVASLALPKEVADRAGEALRAGYLSEAPATDLSELGLYTAFNLFKLTPHPFRDRNPDWPEQTARLLIRCRQLMCAHEIA